jgi:hypothetical protein
MIAKTKAAIVIASFTIVISAPIQINSDQCRPGSRLILARINQMHPLRRDGDG